jgi:hypothetical protein
MRSFVFVMTKSSRRAAHPDVAAFVDDMREVFGAVSIDYVNVPGYVFGKPGECGVIPNVEKRDERTNSRRTVDRSAR